MIGTSEKSLVPNRALGRYYWVEMYTQVIGSYLGSVLLLHGQAGLENEFKNATNLKYFRIIQLYLQLYLKPNGKFI